MQCLSYITDKESVRVVFAIAKSMVQQQNLIEAEKNLHHLFTNVDPELTDALVLYGHCKFINNQYDESIKAYYRAIRIQNLKGEGLNDSLVHQRIGAILIKQKKWMDAKVVFEMCCKKYETAFSFMNLGIACLYLEDYKTAESVLAKANILDITNANVWGFMTLVMLKNGNRVNNAFQALKEAIRLKILNSELLLDISHSFADAGQNETAKKALQYALVMRASKENARNQKKVQEFFLQVNKVLTEYAKQKEQNNAGYAEQAEVQISQIYNEILMKSGAVPKNDGLSALLFRLYLESVT